MSQIKKKMSKYISTKNENEKIVEILLKNKMVEMLVKIVQKHIIEIISMDVTNVLKNYELALKLPTQNVALGNLLKYRKNFNFSFVVIQFLQKIVSLFLNFQDSLN